MTRVKESSVLHSNPKIELGSSEHEPSTLCGLQYSSASPSLDFLSLHHHFGFKGNLRRVVSLTVPHLQHMLMRSHQHQKAV